MNSEYGIYGTLNNVAELEASNKELELATRNEIKIGDAKILLNLENGNKKEYNIKIIIVIIKVC